MAHAVVMALIVCALSAVFAQNGLPVLPPDFQCDMIQRTSYGGQVTIVQGHIWSDDLHNRTRFDYVANNVSYSLFMFIDETAQQETDYLLITTSNYQGCTKRVSAWSGNQYSNCGRWQNEGTKQVNGHKVTSYQTNCTSGQTPNTQVYSSEWLLADSNQPFEFVMFSSNMYSEIDYLNFVNGAGSRNASVYTLPARCQSAATSSASSGAASSGGRGTSGASSTSGRSAGTTHSAHTMAGGGAAPSLGGRGRTPEVSEIAAFLASHARSVTTSIDSLMYEFARVLPRLPRM